jgi:hypothetical protein
MKIVNLLMNHAVLLVGIILVCAVAFIILINFYKSKKK